MLENVLLLRSIFLHSQDYFVTPMNRLLDILDVSYTTPVRRVAGAHIAPASTAGAALYSRQVVAIALVSLPHFRHVLTKCATIDLSVTELRRNAHCNMVLSIEAE